MVTMAVLESEIRSALTRVQDPEIRKPITDLGMVKSVDIRDDSSVDIEVYLTTAGCPMRTEITDRVTKAVADVAGVGEIRVTLDVMNDEQRTALRKSLRGDSAEPVIPFAQPGSLTRVYAVASGKGGVGKSSVTVNLAAALADRGLSVGVLDADIYGHSIPRMLGTSAKPTQVERMIMPPVAHEVKMISIAQFTEGTLRWCGAARCCTGRCSSSSPMCSGAISTCFCSTFRPARATSRSPSHSWSPTRRSSW